jgi:pimeloyl-ACP methyl ester carboxylesterase
MTTVPLRDTRLAYIEQGRGEPLIFVHGTLGSMADFPAQFEFFSPSFRVIAYSRRFHPPNPVHQSEDSYSLSVQAADLAEIIEALGISPATVIGSSYGGYVALCCAIRHPGFIERLVLGEPPMLPLLKKTHEGEIALEEFEANALSPARAAFAGGDETLGVRKFFDGVSGRRGSFDLISALSRERLMESARTLRLELLAGADEYMPAIPDDQIHSALVPVLLLNGQRSPRMFSLITDELERLLPDTYRVLIPGAGHAMHAANPGFFNGVLRDFLTPI